MKCRVADELHSSIGTDSPDLTGAPTGGTSRLRGPVHRRIGELETSGDDLRGSHVLGQVGHIVRHGPTELRHQRQPSWVPRGAMEIGASDAGCSAGDDHGADADGVAVHDDDQMGHAASHDIRQRSSVGLTGRRDDDEIGVRPDRDACSGEQRGGDVRQPG
jgi:hypothetical protein